MVQLPVGEIVEDGESRLAQERRKKPPKDTHSYPPWQKKEDLETMPGGQERCARTDPGFAL